eukprot:766383-Hanusia_phi.AAC.1
MAFCYETCSLLDYESLPLQLILSIYTSQRAQTSVWGDGSNPAAVVGTNFKLKPKFNRVDPAAEADSAPHLEPLASENFMMAAHSVTVRCHSASDPEAELSPTVWHGATVMIPAPP